MAHLRGALLINRQRMSLFAGAAYARGGEEAPGHVKAKKLQYRMLDCVVVNECYVLLESSKSWRPGVLKLTEMAEKDTQVLYLTATLPPVLQPAFLQTASLNSSSVTICREVSTSRHNIAYQALEYAREKLDSVLVALVQAKN
ncbi:hypothetical protein GQ44DRAFT_775082 [Phaeosphaeriaceae sp. PMI808]|nr:hypothetical protein GQ44DRAFT_775082 [Phaeosphaeriaceae sp. PMI808]